MGARGAHMNSENTPNHKIIDDLLKTHRAGLIEDVTSLYDLDELPDEWKDKIKHSLDGTVRYFLKPQKLQLANYNRKTYLAMVLIIKRFKELDIDYAEDQNVTAVKNEIAGEAEVDERTIDRYIVDYRAYISGNSHKLSARKLAAIYWAIEQANNEDVWND